MTGLSPARAASPRTALVPSPVITAMLALTWATLWASAFIAMKIGLHSASAAVLVAGRCVVAGAILLAIRWPIFRSVTRRQLRDLSILGVLNNAGYLGIIGTALPHLSAGMAAILSACTPLLVLTYSTARGNRSFSLLSATGVALASGGIALAAWDRLDAGTITATGMALGAVAVICLSAATVVTPRLAGDIDPTFATGWQALTAAIPLGILALTTPSSITWTGRLIAVIAFLAVGATVLGMSAWLLLIRRAGTDNASVAHFLPPVIGVALSALLLHEHTTKLQTIALVPVALGIVLALVPTRENRC